MVKIISFLVIVAGFGYLINYFFNNSMAAFSVNGAYREMNQKTCREVSQALTAQPDAENRKKADIYLGEMASERFSIEKMQDNMPNEWQRLVQQFTLVCDGNAGMPGDEIMQRIPRAEVLGQGK